MNTQPDTVPIWKFVFLEKYLTKIFDIKQDMKNITLNIIGLILSIEGSIVFIIDAEDSTSTR